MSDGLPDGWSLLRIGDAFDCWGGMTPSTANPAYWGGSMPWISSKDVKTWWVVSGTEAITARALSETRLRECPPGTVLVVVRSGVLAHTLPVAITKGPVVVNQDLKALSSGDTELNEWLALYLRCNQRSILEANRKDGTTVQSIRVDELLDRALPVPPAREQRRIVEKVDALLEQVNRAKARLERVRLILKRFRQSVLTAACSGDLTSEWRKANGISKPWRDAVLGELLREPLRNGHSAKQSVDGSGVPTFSLSAFTYGDFTGANVKMTVADPTKVVDLWVQPNDIYVERSNTPELVGTSRLYDGAPGMAIVPDLVIRVRLREDEAVPRFIEHCLRSQRGRDYFIDRAQGTSGSMPKIDQAAVAAFPLSLPSPGEQHEIVRQVNCLFAIADTIEHRVGNATARIRKLPQAILSKAFSGELVPIEAELARAERRTYETGEQLLARVVAAAPPNPSSGKRRHAARAATRRPKAKRA